MKYHREQSGELIISQLHSTVKMNQDIRIRSKCDGDTFTTETYGLDSKLQVKIQRCSVSIIEFTADEVIRTYFYKHKRGRFQVLR